jgi:uncharacterized protein (DUF1684 family)
MIRTARGATIEGMRSGSHAFVDLLDWKRRAFELYASVRGDPDPAAAWRRWRETRDALFAGHPQSPLPEEQRASFRGLSYFDYDGTYRVAAELEPGGPERLEIPMSTGGASAFSLVAKARFTLDGRPLALGVYWLEAYGSGAFVSFRDATSGRQTYGACRYLLDTVKGADLGMDGDRLVLDFNFSYNPSCAYHARWACPLAPPENGLGVEIRAGELAPGLEPPAAVARRGASRVDRAEEER